MDKYLELGVPVSNCYQFMAFPLAILSLHSQSEDWIYSNFIQICFDLNLSPIPYYYYIYDYTISPWLDVQRLQKDILQANSINLLSFIENSLNINYYVYCFVDEYYIPNRISYMKYHYFHDILINGYDSQLKQFNIFGYDEKYILASTMVSYDAFQSAITYENSNDPYLSQIILYKFKSNGNYSFSMESFIEQLNEYLNGINSSKRFGILRDPWDRVYGIDSYHCLTKYLEKRLIDKNFIDIRIFHFLYEHKKLMQQRIDYLLRNGLINDKRFLDDWSVLVTQAEMIRNKILRSRIVGFTNEKLQVINKTLNNMYLDEKKTLSDLITLLS